GRIDALRVISEGRVHAGRLDYIGYQFISDQNQDLARRYADGEIGLDALEQGILGR
ncbi:MAG: hypothetical protein GY785_15725, partial [Gammaproteobacteria bacterium]|nr:hypothetical protein [Gammaproteobacteria bacterium]